MLLYFMSARHKPACIAALCWRVGRWELLLSPPLGWMLQAGQLLAQHTTGTLPSPPHPMFSFPGVSFHPSHCLMIKCVLKLSFGASEQSARCCGAGQSRLRWSLDVKFCLAGSDQMLGPHAVLLWIPGHPWKRSWMGRARSDLQLHLCRFVWITANLFAPKALQPLRQQDGLKLHFHLK